MIKLVDSEFLDPRPSAEGLQHFYKTSIWDQTQDQPQVRCMQLRMGVCNTSSITRPGKTYLFSWMFNITFKELLELKRKSVRLWWNEFWLEGPFWFYKKSDSGKTRLNGPGLFFSTEGFGSLWCLLEFWSTLGF